MPCWRSAWTSPMTSVGPLTRISCRRSLGGAESTQAMGTGRMATTHRAGECRERYPAEGYEMSGNRQPSFRRNPVSDSGLGSMRHGLATVRTGRPTERPRSRMLAAALPKKKRARRCRARGLAACARRRVVRWATPLHAARPPPFGGGSPSFGGDRRCSPLGRSGSVL